MTRRDAVLRAAARFLAALAALGAAADATALTGEVTHLSGAVMAQGVDGRSRILSAKSEVKQGDVIATTDNSYARIKFADATEVVLRPNSQLKIDAFIYEEGQPQSDNMVMSLLKGGLRSVTGLLGKRNPANFRLASPTATIGIRGTHFGALYCAVREGKNDCEDVPSPGGPPAAGLHVDVADGAIIVSTKAGSQEFKVGQFGYVASFSVVPVLVPADQGTRVTLPPQALAPNILGGTVGKSGDMECQVR